MKLDLSANATPVLDPEMEALHLVRGFPAPYTSFMPCQAIPAADVYQSSFRLCSLATSFGPPDHAKRASYSSFSKAKQLNGVFPV